MLYITSISGDIENGFWLEFFDAQVQLESDGAENLSMDTYKFVDYFLCYRSINAL